MGTQADNTKGGREIFFRTMWAWLKTNHAFPGLTDDSDPVHVWERLKALSPTGAEKGLREAVRDLLEMTQRLGDQELEAVDLYLRDRGAPTLTSVRLQQKRFLKRLIKQGRISRAEEYRFLVSLLSDVGDTGLDEEQRNAVSRLVSEFEARGRPENQ